MPYAEKSDYQKAHRERFGTLYATDPKFREAEAARKADWYQRNRAKVIAKVLERREALMRKAKG